MRSVDAGHRRPARAGARRGAERGHGDHAGVGRAEAFGDVGDAEAPDDLVADRRAAEAEDDAQRVVALELRRLAA